MCGSSVWWGFTSDMDRQKVKAFIRRSIRAIAPISMAPELMTLIFADVFSYIHVIALMFRNCTVWLSCSADKDIDSKISTNVKVAWNGDCIWITPGVFQSSCPIDVSWFPFDDQLCSFKFSSWMYNGFQLDLHFYANVDSIDIADYVENGEWSLVGMSTACTHASVHIGNTSYQRIFSNVSQCVCLSVCEHLLSRISWSIFAKAGTDVRTPKGKTSSLGVNIAPPIPLFAPPSNQPHFIPRGPENTYTY